MELIQWRNGLPDPFQEFDSLQEQINQLFDVARIPEPRGIFEGEFSPAVDVIEDANSFEVLCDVPGLDIKDVEISVSGNVLTIKGEKAVEQRSSPRAHGEKAWSGRFQRTLQMPLSVDHDRVDAVLRDGVLRITLPKSEEMKPRQIKVKQD